MDAFLALIVPMPGLPAQPPGGGAPPPGIPTHPIWRPDLGPSHPIAPGGPPPSIWPGPGPLPHPEHPIAPGGPPPVIWPGPGPLPHPEHPIAPGGPPPGIWGGGNEPFPTPPIVIPPPLPDSPLPDDKMLVLINIGGKWYWAVIDRPAEPGETPPGYNPPSGGNVPQPV